MNRQDFFDRIAREDIELGVEFELVESDLLRLANGGRSDIADEADAATIVERRDRAEALARSWDASFDELSGFDRDWVVDAVVAADRTDMLGEALDSAVEVYVLVPVSDAQAASLRDALANMGVARADLAELHENLMEDSSSDWPDGPLLLGFVAQIQDIARNHDQRVTLTVRNPTVQVGLRGQDYPTNVATLEVVLDHHHEAEQVEFIFDDTQVLARSIRTIGEPFHTSGNLSYAQRVQVARELVLLGRHGDFVRANLVELNNGCHTSDIERAVFESNRLAYKTRMGRRAKGSKAEYVKAAKAAATSAIVQG